MVQVNLLFNIKGSMHVYQEMLMLPLDNFAGQLGGLVGLYIGWSFLQCGLYLLKKLFAFLGSIRKQDNT